MAVTILETLSKKCTRRLLHIRLKRFCNMLIIFYNITKIDTLRSHLQLRCKRSSKEAWKLGHQLFEESG